MKIVFRLMYLMCIRFGVICRFNPMKSAKFIVVAVAVFFVSLAGFSQKQKTKKSPTQGICGTVTWRSGNNMPSPDVPASKGRPVVRQVLIYELTNVSQTTNDAGFYRNPKSRLIRSVQSKKDGTFCVSLPAGYYSVFVREEKGLYANQLDDANNIFPVKVERRLWQKIDFEINYEATY